MNRLISTLIFGSLLSLVACAPASVPSPPSHSQTAPSPSTILYENPIYRYNISYPRGWEVDAADMSSVDIYKYPSLVLVNIYADNYRLPLATRVDIFIKSNVYLRENAQLLHSAEPKLKWDWVLHYQYVWKGKSFQAQAYFLETSHYSYTIYWEASGDSELYKTCQNITLTFTPY